MRGIDSLRLRVANDTTIHQVNGPIPVTPGEEISLTAEAASEGYQFHAWAQGGKKVEGTRHAQGQDCGHQQRSEFPFHIFSSSFVLYSLAGCTAPPLEGTGNSLTITYADVDKGAVNAIFDVRLDIEAREPDTTRFTVCV